MKGYNKKSGWLSSISGLINLRKRPNNIDRDDIYLMADIAHQIVVLPLNA
jgi:hypothetical protein